MQIFKFQRRSSPSFPASPPKRKRAREQNDKNRFHQLQLKIKDIEQLFLEPEWALSQYPMRPRAEWAIGLIGSSAAIVLVFKAGAFRY